MNSQLTDLTSLPFAVFLPLAYLISLHFSVWGLQGSNFFSSDTVPLTCHLFSPRENVTRAFIETGLAFGLAFVCRSSFNLASTQVASSLPSVFSFPGPYSPSVLDERIGEFKEHLETLRLKESPDTGAGEPGGGGWSLGSEPFSRQNHMSQRQATPVQAANGANGPNQLSPRRRPTLPPIQAYSPSKGQSQHEQKAESPTSAVGPSPNDRQPGSATFPEPRLLKMHAILNHPGSSDETASQRSSIPPDSYPHRSTSESPASSNGPLTPGKSFSLSNGSPQLPNVRHPIPSMRGPGGTAINAPTATIDAKKSPFLTNHVQGSYQQPMEIHHGRLKSPTGVRPIYPYQQSNLIKAEERRGSDASQIIPSQSNSPTTSLTSYGTGTGSRTSPVLQYSQCVTLPQDHLKKVVVAPAPGSVSAYGSPMNGTGQGSYQLMTIDTDQGPVQVPVDVQAASKVADEKRKRNAGASARFRQRRKEKEREASQSISRLESKVRELSDEKEFYKVERDYFRQLVYNSPAQAAQVIPRPPSPRQRKTSIDTSSTGTPEWQQNGERGSDDGRNQRRRISGFYEPGPGQVPPPPPQAQGPPPTSHNPHATYPPQQPSYAYPPPDPRSRAPPPPHTGTPIPGQSSISGPPPLRPGHYDAGIPPRYDHAYFPPRG